MDPIVRLICDFEPTDEIVVVSYGSFCLAIGALPEDPEYHHLVIETGVVKVIPHLQEQISLNDPPLDRIDSDEIRINQIKSCLIYRLQEIVPDDGLYWKLIKIPDEAQTEKRVTFKLYYNLYPIEVHRNDPFRERFQNLDNWGTLLVSSRHLPLDAPGWVVRSFFRSIVEANIDTYPIDNLRLMTGHQTGIYYLFGDLVTPEILDTLIDSIVEEIRNRLRSGYWPADTPVWYIQQKSLVQMDNREYRTDLSVRSVITELGFNWFYADFHSWSGTVIDLSQLHHLLIQFPSLDHVSVRVNPSEIQIRYRGSNLEQALTVYRIGKSLGESIDREVQYGIGPPDQDNCLTFWNESISAVCWISS